MERSEIRGYRASGLVPDCASLHPGYVAFFLPLAERLGAREPEPIRYFAVVRRPSIGSISLYFHCEVSTQSCAFLLHCNRPFKRMPAFRPRRSIDHEDIAMSTFAFRRDIITKPIFSWARTVLP